MLPFARFLVLVAGLLATTGGTRQAAYGQTQEEETTVNTPLEVTIRPRRPPTRDGYMQDGVLATNDGRYFLYTGWYIDRLRDRLALGSLADRALRMGIGDVVLEILGEQSRRDPVFISDIGYILGGRYLGMSRLQVARAFEFELGPTPFPRGGFYSAVNLEAPWSMADQFIGPVDFSGSAR